MDAYFLIGANQQSNQSASQHPRLHPSLLLLDALSAKAPALTSPISPTSKVHRIPHECVFIYLPGKIAKSDRDSGVRMEWKKFSILVPLPFCRRFPFVHEESLNNNASMGRQEGRKAPLTTISNLSTLYRLMHTYKPNSEEIGKIQIKSIQGNVRTMLIYSEIDFLCIVSGRP